MAHPPPTPPSDPPGRESVQEELRELRTLLFGPETTSIEQIQKRLDDPKLHAHDVSRVLPLAIRLSARESRQLAPALQGTVEKIFHDSVRSHPEVFVQTLFPIIGPLIRRAISNALRGMLEGLQRTLDSSLSPRSIRWRIEAFRTGRPFSEVVLLHTLRYRVEQVFLIHRETGLVLQHVVEEAAPSQDPDLVSAMLTAIQDFVRDSFQVSEGSGLDTLEFGELSVWIEQGPKAVLAAVIRGNAPAELREDLQEALEEVHGDLQAPLEEFEGDASPFEAGRHILEGCLRTQLKEDVSSGASLKILWIALAVVLALLGLWLWSEYRASSRWAGYLQRLEDEPGIVVTRAAREGGRFFVSGLRDPLAADPQAILAESSLDPSAVEPSWEPFLALEPEIVKRRAGEILALPSSVQLEVRGTVLHLSGESSMQWLAQARDRAGRIPGVSALETSRLSTDQTLTEARRQLEALRLPFSSDAALQGGQEAELDQIRQILQRLDQWAGQQGRTLQVTVVGHTDPLGPEQYNQGLGRRRALAVVGALSGGGAGWPNLRLEAVSAVESGLPSRDRSVTFRIETSGEPR